MIKWIINLYNKLFKKKIDKTEQLKKAVQIIEKKKMDDTIKRVIDSYVYTIKNHPQYVYSDLFKVKTEMIEIEFKDLLEKTIGWKHIENEMYKIYDKYYTSDEIDEMIKFFSTDLGEKILETQETVNTLKMYFVNNKLKDHQQELSKILNKVETMPFNN